MQVLQGSCVGNKQLNRSKMSRVLRFLPKKTTHCQVYIHPVVYKCDPKAVNEWAIDRSQTHSTVQRSLYPSLKIWRHTSRLVIYARSWLCGRHTFPDFQLWPWLVASTRASKRNVRFSAQRIIWNPLIGMAGACLYRQGTSLSLSTLLSRYPTSAECEQQQYAPSSAVMIHVIMFVFWVAASLNASSVHSLLFLE